MKLTKVENLESYSKDQELMRLEFDDGKEYAYAVSSYSNLIQCIGDEVICKFRQDLYEGRVERFVSTFAKLCVISTLQKEEGIKLYTDVTDNHCNVMFREIEDGSVAVDSIVYVVDMRYDSSARADWVDIVAMDKERRVATIRKFSPDSKVLDMRGRYVLCNIRRNKYGFSTDTDIVTVDGGFPYNPEVDIAEKYILSTFAKDSDILAMIKDSGFIPCARNNIDIEPGFMLARLAIELELTSSIANSLGEVDTDLIKRCLLMEKFKVFQKNSLLDEKITGFVMVQKQSFTRKQDVILTLYSSEEKFSLERLTVGKVRELADLIVQMKKGMVK